MPEVDLKEEIARLLCGHLKSMVSMWCALSLTSVWSSGILC